eukprot:scaffold34589_cov163-Skeletonema_dohrnii-CCMP3373.AAC.5
MFPVQCKFREGSDATKEELLGFNLEVGWVGQEIWLSWRREIERDRKTLYIQNQNGENNRRSNETRDYPHEMILGRKKTATTVCRLHTITMYDV